MNRKITGLLAGAALLTAQANAAVLFSDDFSSASSGSGFSEDWTGLTYSAGTGTVNAINGDPDNVFRSLSTAIITTTDFWLVADLTVTGSSSGYAGLGFVGTDGTTSSNDIFIGASSAGTTWGFTSSGTGGFQPSTTSTVPLFTGVETQLVMHFTSTSVDMWINPADTSSEGALGAAVASFSGDSSTNFAWTDVRLASGNASPDPSVTMNNLIAATTFGEAIPEPSTGILVALASATLLLRRRRA